MRISLLGELEVFDNDDRPVIVTGAKQRALLAMLALHPGQMVPADQLVEGLWGENPPPAVRNGLQGLVSKLRRLLGSAGVIVMRGGGYALDVPPDAVDTHHFEQLVAQGRTAAANGDLARAVTLLSEADAMWRGEALYRARWNNELDLRSIKSTMKMDVLRCKTPELVHKEIWTHILAYNLIRTIMAQAAAKRGIQPRTISFKGALQTLEAFQPLIDFQGRRDSSLRAVLYQQLLDAVALHRVANRPDRFEPRYRKRRSKRYAELKMPRREAKLAILKGVSKN